ncbi:hypothetical protein GCK32_021116 [Trichostrongylus colubriformis]|uniref:Uncharacterized protein n=1 Tax=Trichostrongylus colubriformis TaxID=6319 RepID=A0AAN8IL48_TRICO
MIVLNAHHVIQSRHGLHQRTSESFRQSGMSGSHQILLRNAVVVILFCLRMIFVKIRYLILSHLTRSRYRKLHLASVHSRCYLNSIIRWHVMGRLRLRVYRLHLM